jgi:HAMP domain-containing protein
VRALPVLALLALTGCLATKGDLTRIHARMEHGERQIADVMDQFSAGTATQVQVVETIKAAAAGNVEEVAAVVETIEARGDKISTTASLWMEAFGGVLGVAASVVLTNYMRDRKRVERGEPIGTQPSPSAEIVSAVAADMKARASANVDAGRI